MANQEHLEILKRGKDPWNQWRKEHPEIVPDLSNADLREIVFGVWGEEDDENEGTGALTENTDQLGESLLGVDLSGVKMNGARSENALFFWTNFSNADLGNVNLAFAF